MILPEAREAAYRYIDWFRSWESLYRLYTSNSRGYEIIQVVRREDRTHPR
jgi:hypothetical protein